jgi:hypothetical protein
MWATRWSRPTPDFSPCDCVKPPRLQAADYSIDMCKSETYPASLLVRFNT